MSRRRVLTPLLIAILMLTSTYNVSATDSDGDGTDDANDAFPNDPCADTDTDGDGMPDTLASGCSGDYVVAYTSFEDPFTISSVKYTDTGNESVDRYLWNNANEPHVAHNQTTGSEMGFSLYYESNGGVGLTDGDYFGTIDYTGTVGNFTDGDNGYQMSDVDGITTMQLDNVTAEILTFDMFLQDTAYETSTPVDYLIVTFRGSNSDISILNTTGYDIDSSFSSYLGTWTSTTVSISAAGQGFLEVEFSSNSAMEALYLDNIQFISSSQLVEDDDDDNDGWSDSDEASCGTNHLDSSDYPVDADSNGICDALEGDDFDGDGIPNDTDSDDDNDGVEDVDDDFPLNPNETTDTDMDGTGDNADEDDDNDGWSDTVEIDCGSDSLDPSSVPIDADSDGVCDALDEDTDGDGVADADDAFPNDPTEWSDADGDGKGDNVDDDDDNDGVPDIMEERCFSDPLDPLSLPTDTDGDGDCDPIDYDDDDDGYTDQVEGWCGSDPLDINSVPVDSDGDGECDVMDNDSDNDGVDDANDAFPDDATEWVDTDMDGWGDNADYDDDGDGWLDTDEDSCDSDSMDSGSVPADLDGDGECDGEDFDIDGVGVVNPDDDFPNDSSEWYDLDGDGIGDNADEDVDDDGWTNSVEAECAEAGGDGDPNNANVQPSDIDNDGNCDALDPDDDGDGVADGDDAFPDDGTEWLDTDGDGTGNNADTDDDGDQFSDDFELECESDSLDPDSIPSDIDSDDICDPLDDFNDIAENDETPGFGLISALAMLAIAAFARRD